VQVASPGLRTTQKASRSAGTSDAASSMSARTGVIAAGADDLGDS
jgi:hypothetical protein